MQMEEISNTHTFVTLDGLRGIAALAVVTRHAPDFFQQISWVDICDRSIPNCVTLVGPFFESYLAVDFFFVLSGFVLAHAYERRVLSDMKPRQFLALRLLRLYPLYLLALVLGGLMALQKVRNGDMGALGLAKNLLFGVASILIPPSFH
jgi:peptidoglycan/LPS O-acetylase OafA/YrhL